ncbi:hypothetical protein EVAR_45848_1 [Eumeta japonica]|uniref:Uncharacterized protein n=1 Tax=Eumeta variegata TaxID=151549 RepID=A0A4C1WNV9_EUMVA|nr:hypothetical protein EVAR_45848_1 [Eumeta japonica]
MNYVPHFAGVEVENYVSASRPLIDGSVVKVRPHRTRQRHRHLNDTKRDDFITARRGVIFHLARLVSKILSAFLKYCQTRRNRRASAEMLGDSARQPRRRACSLSSALNFSRLIRRNLLFGLGTSFPLNGRFLRIIIWRAPTRHHLNKELDTRICLGRYSECGNTRGRRGGSAPAAGRRPSPGLRNCYETMNSSSSATERSARTHRRRDSSRLAPAASGGVTRTGADRFASRTKPQDGPLPTNDLANRYDSTRAGTVQYNTRNSTIVNLGGKASHWHKASNRRRGGKDRGA